MYTNNDELEKKMNEAINHPSHYCDHESGVETITITRYLNCDCANAWKYCMRYLAKYKKQPEHATPKQDLGKAIFYLNDYLANFVDGSGNVNSIDYITPEVIDRMTTVADCEKIPAVQNIFNDIISMTVAREIDMIKIAEDIENLEKYRATLPK